jgi:hypothetical protein
LLAVFGLAKGVKTFGLRRKTMKTWITHGFDKIVADMPAPKELKKEIGLQMKLERVSAYKRFKTSSDEHTPEERFQMLADYLDKYGFITRSSYSELTGLLKTKASTELKKWYQEKKIDKDGRAPHIVYKKRELQMGSSLQESENQPV